jgi:hypothetical protein
MSLVRLSVKKAAYADLSSSVEEIRGQSWVNPERTRMLTDITKSQPDSLENQPLPYDQRITCVPASFIR